MNKTRVKICGITRTEDAIAASSLGAWAIGYIFAPQSKRYIPAAYAGEISAKIPAKIQKIGVFVNEEIDKISNTIQTAGLSKVQLHGEESPEFICRLKEKSKIKIIKAFRISCRNNIEILDKYRHCSDYFLLDSYCEKEHGGTGKTFNWKLAKEAKSFGIPIIIAGGITPDNVVSAYEEVKPYAIDLSSGVEKSKGIKDHEKLRNLFGKLEAV